MNLICVLGMHRSGTSAATGLIVSLGASAGPSDEMIPPLPENPLGFFENVGLTQINRSVLRKLGGYWSFPPTFRQGWEDEDRFESERRQLAELLERLAADSPSHLVIKDPRLSLTQPLVAAVHPVAANVLCVRHPGQVAASLAKRNGLPLERSLYLWLRYTVTGMLAQPAPLVARYDDLISGDLRSIIGLADALGLETDEEQVQAAVNKSVDADLAHHIADTPVRGSLGEAATEVYDHLVSGPSKPEGPDLDIDLIVQLFGRQPWASPGMAEIERATDEATVETKSLRQKLDKVEQEKQQAHDGVLRRDAEIASLRGEAKQARRVADDLRTEFVTQSKQATTMQEQLASAARKAADYERRLLVLERDLEKAEQAAKYERFKTDDLTKRIATLEAQRERLRADRKDALDRLNTLGGRRAVKVALRATSLARPRRRRSKQLEQKAAEPVDPADSAGSVGSNGEPDGRLSQSFDRAIDSRTRVELSEYHRKHRDRLDSIMVSIVMPTFNRAETVVRAIESVLAQTHNLWELHVVDDGSTDDTHRVVDEIHDERVNLHVVEHAGVSAARNVGLSHASGDVVAYLDSDNVWDPEYLRLTLAGMERAEVGCTYTAMEAVDQEGVPQYFRGAPFDWEQCRQGNYVDLNVFAHRRSAADDLRFDLRLRRMVDWDFILRMTRSSSVAYLSFLGCVYLDDRSRLDRISNAEPSIYGKLVRLRYQPGGEVRSWEEVAANLRLTFSVKIPAPRDKKAAWGDYHFAESLVAALRKLGHDADIVFLNEWEGDPGGEDVSLVLRGLSRFEPRRGPINLMWNISHPDKIGFDEFARYDIVYTASDSFAHFLQTLPKQARLTKSLPQATDADRFHPGRREENSPYAAPVLFVGNSRKDFRDIIRWSVEAGIEVTIFGQHWTPFIDGPNVRDELISNEALGAAYASSGVVLNDHWASMRDFGIISNRVFDVVATGAHLVSDRLDAIEAMFGDLVAQVSSPDELRAVIDADGSSDEQRLEASRWVLTHHSFDTRARQIVADVHELIGIPSLDRPPLEMHLRGGNEQRRPVRRIRLGVVLSHGPHGPQSSAFIRIFAPLTSGVAAGRVELVALSDPSAATDVDVILIQRLAVESAEAANTWIDASQRSDIPLVIDIDDAFDLMGDDHPETGLFEERSAVLRLLIDKADQIWCSTEAVANVYVSELDKAHVIPNSLDPRLWRRYVRSADAGATPHAEIPQLLFMGTSSHRPDLELVLPQLSQLRETRAFELTVIGPRMGDTCRKDWVTCAVIPDTARTYPSFVRWLRDQGPFDIGLAPLVENAFNAAKSDVKLLDYAALGLATVASTSPAFHESIEGGLAVGAGPAEWADKVGELLDDHGRRANMASRAEHALWTERSADATGVRLVEILEDLVQSTSTQDVELQP